MNKTVVGGVVAVAVAAGAWWATAGRHTGAGAPDAAASGAQAAARPASKTTFPLFRSVRASE